MGIIICRTEPKSPAHSAHPLPKNISIFIHLIWLSLVRNSIFDSIFAWSYGQHLLSFGVQSYTEADCQIFATPNKPTVTERFQDVFKPLHACTTKLQHSNIAYTIDLARPTCRSILPSRPMACSTAEQC